MRICRKKNRESIENTRYTLKDRKLASSKIKRFSNAVSGAIKYRKNMNATFDKNLRKIIKSISVVNNNTPRIFNKCYRNINIQIQVFYIFYI